MPFTIRGAILCAILPFTMLGCGDDGSSSSSGDTSPTSSTSSGDGCTLIGCGSAFFVEFTRAAAWDAGSYAVRVTADGSTTECAATLPLTCSAPSACPEGVGFSVILSGCALDPSQHALGGVEFEQGTTPATVSVEVLRDGTSLATGTFMPTYTTSMPNGPNCEPTCESAPNATLVIP